MITNQLMQRSLGDLTVTKRTKDGFFNATALINQWNDMVKVKPQNLGVLKSKDLEDYFVNKSTTEFIQALQTEENMTSKDEAYVSTRGKHGGTWMHPLLFMDFAAWLNPHFKVKVYKFAYDQMIKYRNDAGDAYRELSSAVSRIVHRDHMKISMQKLAEAMNYIVYGKHEPMMRNKVGEEEKVRELLELERKVTDLINEGFIKSWENLINYLRNLYYKKTNPKVFQP